MTQQWVFTLKSFRGWEQEVEGAIRQFIKVHGAAPDLLVCNEATYQRLQVAFGTGLLEQGALEHPVQIGSLDWGIAETRMATNASLQDMVFLLEREGGGEEKPPIVAPGEEDKARPSDGKKVLDIGFEGGGITVYEGFIHDRPAPVYRWSSASDITGLFDHLEDAPAEKWQYDRSEPFDSIYELLRTFGERTPWCDWHLSYLSPEQHIRRDVRDAWLYQVAHPLKCSMPMEHDHEIVTRWLGELFDKEPSPEIEFLRMARAPSQKLTVVGQWVEAWRFKLVHEDDFSPEFLPGEPYPVFDDPTESEWISNWEALLLQLKKSEWRSYRVTSKHRCFGQALMRARKDPKYR